MANRKQELDTAIAQSNQRAQEAAAPAPQPAAPQSRTADFKLPYTQQQEAAAAAPISTKRGVENILQKQEVKEAWNKKRGMTEEQRQQRIAAGRKSTEQVKKRIESDPEIQKKAQAAADKFLGKKKAKAPSRKANTLRIRKK